MTTSPFAAALVCAALASGASAAPPPDCPATVDGLRITVVYDDHRGDPGLTPEVGFACLVEAAEWTVLFDTGGSPEVLAHNLRALGVEAGRLRTVVLSHVHGDHTGGVPAVLDPGAPPTLYAPAAIAEGIRRVVGDGGHVAPVTGPMSILPGLCTLGPMGGEIVEQALVVHTPRGLVVVTGCAHPGIADVVERAATLMEADVLLVVGGFHLRASSLPEIEAVVHRLASLGVRHVAPCHCTGAEATTAFEAAFGPRCHRLGAGARIDVAELE